jgi:hypothetical protein
MFFEVTGIAQFPLALVVARDVWRFARGSTGSRGRDRR